MRESEVWRKTGETEVRVRLNLDGTGKNEIRTGVGFLDHMLELFARPVTNLFLSTSAEDPEGALRTVGLAAAFLRAV